MINSSQDATCELDDLRQKVQTYEAWLRAINEYADFDVWFKDADSTYRYVNEKFEKALGKSREDLLGKKPADVFSEPDRCDRVIKLDKKVMEDGLLKRVVPCDGSGKLEMHEEHRFAVKDETGNPIGLGCFAFEVTEKSLIEEALAQAQKMARLGNWRWSVRNNNLISCSENLADMLGVDMPTVFSLMPNRLENFVHPEDRDRVATIISDSANGLIERYEIEYRLVNAKNNTIDVREIAESISGNDNKIAEYIVTLQDITQEKTNERGLLEANQLLESRVSQRTADLRHLADHDQLTGLLNRNAFVERILDDLGRTSEISQIVLFAMDLDGFKGVNDCFGHFVGDELLKIVAQRITAALDGEGFVSRLGGDEFGVVIPVKNDSIAEANAVYQNIKSRIDEKILIDNLDIYVGLSAGYAVAQCNRESIASAMKFADIALYQAKELRSGNAIAYEQHMAKAIEFRRRLERDLSAAITNGEIYMVYQPQFCADSGAIRGVEALARWQHPELGNVPPQTFVKAAEESGMIHKLGEFVLHQSCQQIADFMDASGKKFDVSINLSTAQFYNRDLLPTIKEALSSSGLSPECLELEITESLFMRNTTRTQRLLSEIRNTGIRVALDDFGTGYSSLGYLKRFKVDTIKLDRSFIRDIEFDRASRKIVKGIISLAGILGLKVVAEGVENSDQMQILKQQKCDFLQGFLLGKPMELGELNNHFRNFTPSLAQAHCSNLKRPA